MLIVACVKNKNYNPILKAFKNNVSLFIKSKKIFMGKQALWKALNLSSIEEL
jgi:hypothetical protein